MLAIVAIAGIGALVAALGLGGDPAKPDAASVTILPDPDSNDSLSRGIASAKDINNTDPASTVTLDVLLAKSSDVSEFAPGSRTPMLGGGKTATLRGKLTDQFSRAIEGAIIKILHGLNEGASTTTNAAGIFEIPNLYSGVAIIEVSAPKQPAIHREIRLRANREEIFDFTYLDHGNVHGAVYDEGGKPIVGAKAELDGIVTSTDRDGAFFFNGVVPGNCILYLSAPGFEYRKEGISLRAMQALVFDVNRFVLRKSEPLTVAFDPLPISPRPPKVLILPNGSESDHSFPFEKIGVVSPRPGDATVKIEGIPLRDSYQVRVYSDSGVASPAMRPVVLKEGDTNLSRAAFAFAWKSPVSGMIMSEGRGVANAKVRVEASDISRGMQELLRDCGGIDRIVVPVLPFVRKEIVANSDGTFQIEASETPAPAVIVIEAPGFARKVIPIKSRGPENLGNIDLQKVAKEGAGELLLGFQARARHEVRFVLDGKAQATQTVPAGTRMKISNLPAGRYAIRVREGNVISLDKWIEISAGENNIRIPAAIPAPGDETDDEPEPSDDDTDPDKDH
ncbi:MAG: carboxypeptidase regulatory-like domain-containing protein [Planctomycetota bacterium]